MSAAIRNRLHEVGAALDLRRVVQSVGEVAPAQWAEALPAARARRLRRLVISGCGDSLFAGIATRLAIERFGGIACEALDALEAGRYASPGFSPDVAVLGISNSGATSRVVESVGLARAAGAVTLALSGAAASPLAQTAGAGVVRPVEGAGARDGPTARVERHIGEYVGTLAALYHLAFHLGVARGLIDEPQRRQQVSALADAADLAQRALADGPERVTGVLEGLQDADRIFFLGAGPAYATALFGAAKVLEEVPLCGIPQHLEAWAHLQYFLAAEEGSRTRVVIVAPPGDSTDRAAEIARSIREGGGVVVAVTHAAEAEVCAAASAVVIVDGDCWEGYAPLPYAVPLQLLGLALAMHGGRTVIPLSRRDGGRLIRASAVRTRTGA